MKIKILIMAVFIVLISFAGLYFSFMKTDVHLSPDSKIPSANNDFAFRLFHRMSEGEHDKNVFISPLSISVALSMTLNGAGGATKESMTKTLGFTNIPLDAINQDNAVIMQSLIGSDSKVKVSIANSLWMRKGVNFKKDFLSRTRKSYNAEITTLDFNSPGSPNRVNKWVSKATRGKIDKIVNAENFRNSVLMLVNAIYFNGKWTEPFEKTSTVDQEFHLSDGVKTVKMMHQGGEYLYSETPDFQAVRLPYGDERYSMYIFLPSENTGLDAFLSKLDAGNWNKLTSAMTKRDGSIALPRFKIEYEVELNSVLESLGMGNAFSESAADFSGMSDIKPLYISDVIHKSYLDVNEEGTEAAAATAVVMAPGCAPMAPTQRFNMIVDRPFFSVIYDNETKTILFMGAVVEP